jgi:hypothetical protein
MDQEGDPLNDGRDYRESDTYTDAINEDTRQRGPNFLRWYSPELSRRIHHLVASWALSPMMSYWDSFPPVRTCTCFPSFQTATAAPPGCFHRDSR